MRVLQYFWLPSLLYALLTVTLWKWNSNQLLILLNESEHIYWILDFKGEVHSIWDLWRSGLQECKGKGFYEVGRAGISFRLGLENLDFFMEVAPARIYLP